MENQLVIYLALSVVITSLSWFAYVTKLKSNYAHLKTLHANLNSNIDNELIAKSNENTRDLHDKINELKSQVAEVKHESYNEGYQNAKKEFSVRVFPYKQEFSSGDDGWLINDIYHQVEIGYQYQLFVNGLPILQPAIIIEETLTEEKKQVDFNKVNLAMNAMEKRLMPLIAESKGLMKLVSNKAR